MGYKLKLTKYNPKNTKQLQFDRSGSSDRKQNH